MAPKKLAQKLSDEEVANTAAQKAESAADELSKARILQEKITNMERFIITRKVGAGKNLFGSVSHKQLLEMLKERFPENVTGPTSVIITDIKGKNWLTRFPIFYEKLGVELNLSIFCAQIVCTQYYVITRHSN